MVIFGYVLMYQLLDQLIIKENSHFRPKNTLLNFNLNVLNNISITPNINNTGNTYFL